MHYTNHEIQEDNMLLRKMNSKKVENENKVIMEKVVDDLLMISIKIDSNKNKDYYDYWRLTKTMGIPPLEIGIDGTDGSIQNLVFYIDSNYFKNESCNLTREQPGAVLVDTSIFKKNNDYVDVYEEYYVFCSNKDLICSFMDDFHPDECYINNRIKIFLQSNLIIGFAISDLSNSEIKMLKSVYNS